MASTTRARGARADRAPWGTRDDKAHRPSIYDAVTQRIIAEMEAGCVPWVRPWGTLQPAAMGLPCNAGTARPYSGINILILWGAGSVAGYPSQGWLTFRQALAAGGAVRKGERGTTVVYADHFTPRGGVVGAGAAFGAAEPATCGAQGGAAYIGQEPRAIAFLKRFTVFNVAQCDGLPNRLLTRADPLPEREAVPVAEALIAASGVDFRVGGDRAYYAPGPDYVQVPPQPAFFDQINYYRTCLHELTHATGHRARLDRDLTGSFGSDGYAREELIAEMGAAFLCAALGIVPTVRHADYLGSWLGVLREDSRAIFRAASAASKAADWLLARAGNPHLIAQPAGPAHDHPISGEARP